MPPTAGAVWERMHFLEEDNRELRAEVRLLKEEINRWVKLAMDGEAQRERMKFESIVGSSVEQDEPGGK